MGWWAQLIIMPGLAAGNLASAANALSYSNPQAAALQGIAKMRLLQQMGIKQALLPPHQRPNLHLLHQLGFTGTPAQQVEKASRERLSFLVPAIPPQACGQPMLLRFHLALIPPIIAFISLLPIFLLIYTAIKRLALQRNC